MYLDTFNCTFFSATSWLFITSPTGCQWHDARHNLVALPDQAGVLRPYLKDKDIIHLCQTFNSLARSKGCPGGQYSNCNGKIPVEPQYSYSMSVLLGGSGYTDGRGGIIGENHTLQPTQRYWNLKQLGSTPAGS
jgi:hypothetical protein